MESKEVKEKEKNNKTTSKKKTNQEKPCQIYKQGEIVY
jgi:hypothetical protein